MKYKTVLIVVFIGLVFSLFLYHSKSSKFNKMTKNWSEIIQKTVTSNSKNCFSLKENSFYNDNLIFIKHRTKDYGYLKDDIEGELIFFTEINTKEYHNKKLLFKSKEKIIKDSLYIEYNVYKLADTLVYNNEKYIGVAKMKVKQEKKDCFLQIAVGLTSFKPI